jgi:hypothetical protein
VNAVVIDLQLAVNEQLRAIVRCQCKAVGARLIDPKLPGLVNRKPFEAIGDIRKTLPEVSRRDIQRGRVDGTDSISRAEAGQPSGTLRNKVD